MVDASQVMHYTRFVESLSDKTRLFSSEISDSIVIYANQRSITRVEIQRTQTPQKGQIGFFALYGMITLKSLSYLMLVTKAKMAGQILQRKIIQVEELKFLSLSPNAQLDLIHNDDKIYVDMIKSIVATKTLYFSHEYDLSNSFDKGMANSSQFTNQPTSADKLNYFKLPNQRFAYNWPHIQFLDKLNDGQGGLQVVQYWRSIFISGCVLTNYCRLSQQADCFFILLSRREILRSGKRFTQRGCDDSGNCTNFAETEQIIILDRKETYAVYSYVQTRGSMPFSWKQPPTLKWSPKAYIQGERTYNQELCKAHFDQQMKIYPSQILVNLIDKKGTQKMLGEYYTNLVSALKQPKIKYVWFDFHHECKKMKYENLSKLINEIKDGLKQGSYFHGDIPKQNVNQISKVHSQQVGVVRTNCMDCLDRTNVVQSVIGRYILLDLLHECKIIPSLTGEAFQALPNDLEATFRDLWTRNADYMSILYSGTGALKTDFTRTGKRSTMGALNDGKNSITRYFINNFFDAYNQNCVDLMLGKLKAHEAKVKKASMNLVIKFFIAILLIVYAVSSFLPSLLFEQSPESQFQFVIQIIALLIGIFLTTKVMTKFHKLFVPRPLLEQ